MLYLLVDENDMLEKRNVVLVDDVDYLDSGASSQYPIPISMLL
jgi:hypothetical protein